MKLRKFIIPIALMFGLIGIFSYKMYLSCSENSTHLELPSRKISILQINDLLDSKQQINLVPSNNNTNTIHVFTTWCSCCKDEVLEIQKVTKDHKIIGLVWSNHAEEAKSWLRSNGNYYEKVGIIGDVEAVLLGISKSPVTLVVKDDGSIKCSLQGALTVDSFNANIAPCLKN